MKKASNLEDWNAYFLCLADSSEIASTYLATNDPHRDFIVLPSRLIKDAFFSRFW